MVVRLARSNTQTRGAIYKAPSVGNREPRAWNNKTYVGARSNYASVGECAGQRSTAGELMGSSRELHSHAAVYSRYCVRPRVDRSSSSCCKGPRIFPTFDVEVQKVLNQQYIKPLNMHQCRLCVYVKTAGNKHFVGRHDEATDTNIDATICGARPYPTPRRPDNQIFQP